MLYAILRGMALGVPSILYRRQSSWLSRPTHQFFMWGQDATTCSTNFELDTPHENVFQEKKFLFLLKDEYLNLRKKMD